LKTDQIITVIIKNVIFYIYVFLAKVSCTKELQSFFVLVSKLSGKRNAMEQV